MYIKFKKNVAQGVYYTHAGLGQVAYARKEVIVAAGHRSSFLLENSGVGNQVGGQGRRELGRVVGLGGQSCLLCISD